MDSSEHRAMAEGYLRVAGDRADSGQLISKAIAHALLALSAPEELRPPPEEGLTG